MISDLRVTIKARKPFATAFELDRYDVQLAIPMRTTSFCIDINAKNRRISDLCGIIRWQILIKRHRSDLIVL